MPSVMQLTSSGGKFAAGEIKKLCFNWPMFHLRQRVLIADINAGLTILPAVPHYRYRLHSMAMIAIGGAVTGATDVRILGTQSAASAALMVAAIAGLTQNTKVVDGSAAGVILAGGASYDQMDINTAITVGKTGGAAATATSVDFILSYSLEHE